MSNLFLILMIAFVIIILAIACLAIGWLITGKAKVEKSGPKDLNKKNEDDMTSVSSCQLNQPDPEIPILNKQAKLKSNRKL